MRWHSLSVPFSRDPWPLRQGSTHEAPLLTLLPWPLKKQIPQNAHLRPRTKNGGNRDIGVFFTTILINALIPPPPGGIRLIPAHTQKNLGQPCHSTQVAPLQGSPWITLILFTPLLGWPAHPECLQRASRKNKRCITCNPLCTWFLGVGGKDSSLRWSYLGFPWFSVIHIVEKGKKYRLTPKHVGGYIHLYFSLYSQLLKNNLVLSK